MKTLKIACISLWQAHAKDFARKIVTYPNCHLAAVCDPDPVAGQQWADEMGCRYVQDPEELFRDPELDGVIITSETRKRAEYVIRAARAGKHVFVEKPAFCTDEEACKAMDVVLETGITFLISDPVIKVIRQMVFARELVNTGKLGKITVVRSRSAHTEALSEKQPEGVYKVDESGGGSMNDMGCHACHILAYFLGKPKSARAVFSSVSPIAGRYGVDDNAVALYEYDNGAIGIAETGWVSDQREDGFLISGTEGSVQCMDGQLRYRYGGSGWIEVPLEQWPEAPTYPLLYWTQCIMRKEPVLRENIDEAVLFTQMITAAYRSEGLCEPLS